MKTLSLRLFLPALLIMEASGQLVNPGFETMPFLQGWTATGVTQDPGLNGTATAARLPYNTSAALSQTTPAAADFTFDVCFRSAGTNEEQSFRMTLASGATDVIDVRLGKSGALEIGSTQAGYAPLGTISSGTATSIPASQTIKLRIIGRNFGTTSADYDILWTAPYTTNTAPAFSNAALNLRKFAASPPPLIGGVKFERNITAANSFTVDD
ncbi:MAG TPA: hypothetical protein VM511_00090, partial [Luteolibacter sp.]|nr:hypothetical protein [Luteolibacter sp.]